MSNATRRTMKRRLYELDKQMYDELCTRDDCEHLNYDSSSSLETYSGALRVCVLCKAFVDKNNHITGY